MSEEPETNETFGCRDLLAHLLDVLNGVAEADVVSRVQEHAAGCESCGRLWAIANESSCRELADFLDDYISNARPDDKRAVFDRHMSVCPECVAYLDGYRQTIELARDAEAGAEPAPLPPTLVAAILDARRRGADSDSAE